MHMGMSLSFMKMAPIVTSKNQFEFHNKLKLFFYFTATRMQKLERLLQISTMMVVEMLIIVRASPIATHIMKILLMAVAIIVVEIHRDNNEKCMFTNNNFLSCQSLKFHP